MPAAKPSSRAGAKSGGQKASSRRAAAVGGAARSAVTGPLAGLVDGLVCECRGPLITAINAAGRALLGCGRRSPVGEPFAAFVDGAPSVRLARSVESLAAGRQPKTLTLLNRQGRKIAAVVRAVQLNQAGGKAARILIAAQSVDRAYGLLDSLPVGVLTADEGGIVRSANKTARTLFGLADDRLTGLSATQLLPEWDARAKTETKTAAGYAQDTVGVKSDGGRFRAEVITTLAEGTPHYVIAVRDGGERHAAATAGQGYAEHLAQEVEQRTAEIRMLSKQNQRILEAASDGIVAVALDGTIQSANRAAADMLNRDVSALLGLSVDRAFVFGSGTAVGMPGRPAPVRAQLWTGPFHIALEARLARSDGESFDAEYVIAPITEARETRGYVITFRDITERKRAEAEVMLSAAVFEHSPEGLLVADAKGRVTKTNPAFRRITGFDPSDVVNKSMNDVLFADSKVSATVLDPLRTTTQTEWEQWSKSKTGKRYAARINVSVVRDGDGNVQQYAAIISDITQRKLDEEKILYQANYDQLTGLANRTLFLDRLTRLVVESRRAKTNVGLMFIDLDGFKAINDTLGHDAGDLLLKGTARRLEKCVRETDTVARLGGDEFTVIMPLIEGLEAASMVADRIIRSLSEVFDLDGKPGRVSASIGISILPAQASDASSLLHNADVAMYHAKRQGKANFQIFTPELEARPDQATRL
jgi:diguanylate cyclase (GGDEF)-like protein/PAS domain S-box-containing protein